MTKLNEIAPQDGSNTTRKFANVGSTLLLSPDLQLDACTGHDTRLFEMRAVEVQLHVSEAVDRDHGAANSRRSDLRLG